MLIRSFKIIFVIIISIFLMASYFSYQSLDNLIDDARWVNHTNIILRELEKVISFVKDGETSHRGYQLTSDSLYLQPYYNSKWKALSKIDMIDSMMTSGDRQSQRLDSLRMHVQNQYEVIEEIIRHKKGVVFQEYEDSLLFEGNQNMIRLRKLVDRMADEEWSLLRVKTSQQDYSSKLTPLLILLSFLVAVVAVTYLFSQLYKSLRMKLVTEKELERNLMQLSEEVNEKVMARESLQKVLENSASDIMFLMAVRDENGVIYDFEIVLTNRKGVLKKDGTYESTIGGSLLTHYPENKKGIFDFYRKVVEDGTARKTEVYFNPVENGSWYEVSAVKMEDGCVSTSSDITERKRDADLVRESQKKFEAIFNQTFQFIGLLTPQGEVLDANQTALEFAGVSKKEVKGKLVWDTPLWQRSGTSDTELREAVERAAKGEFVRFEMTIIGKKEQMLPIDFSLKPIEDENGQVHLIIPEGRDLSEVKKAEAERSFVARLNLIIANANSFDQAVNKVFQQISERFDLDYSEVWLPEGKEVKVSDIFYAKEENLARFHKDSRDMFMSGGKGFPGRIMQSFDMEYIEDLNQVDEQEFRRKKEAEGLGLTTAFAIPIIFDNELVLISVFFSKKKIQETEELINAIEQTSSSLGALLIKKKTQDQIEKNNTILATAESMALMGSWEWDLNLNKVKWSKGMYGLYGKSPDAFDPALSTFFEYIHDDDLGMVEEQLQRAMEEGSSYEMNFRVRLDNGEIRHHKAVATPNTKVNGEIDIFYGAVLDVTQQKRYEHDLLIKNEELKKSNENLEQFAYVASHDLQEPLRKIRAFGDRLVTKYEEALDESGKDYISRMRSAAERMQSLIDDLLKYSRIARNLEPFAKVDLNDIIDGVLTDLETRIIERSANIEVAKLPQIDGNRMQLRQLFQNLLSNAIKFTPDDRQPLVTIQGNVIKGTAVKKKYDFNVRPSKQFVEISLKDNGIGFKPKYAERIFNIFERLHGRSEFKGTGIGLAISQKVVQNHDGIITANSEPGHGATFLIVLPINNQLS